MSAGKKLKTEKIIVSSMKRPPDFMEKNYRNQKTETSFLFLLSISMKI